MCTMHTAAGNCYAMLLKKLLRPSSDILWMRSEHTICGCVRRERRLMLRQTSSRLLNSGIQASKQRAASRASQYSCLSGSNDHECGRLKGDRVVVQRRNGRIESFKAFPPATFSTKATAVNNTSSNPLASTRSTRLRRHDNGQTLLSRQSSLSMAFMDNLPVDLVLVRHGESEGNLYSLMQQGGNREKLTG